MYCLLMDIIEAVFLWILLLMYCLLMDIIEVVFFMDIIVDVLFVDGYYLGCVFYGYYC